MIEKPVFWMVLSGGIVFVIFFARQICVPRREKGVIKTIFKTIARFLEPRREEEENEKIEEVCVVLSFALIVGYGLYEFIKLL